MNIYIKKHIKKITIILISALIMVLIAAPAIGYNLNIDILKPEDVELSGEIIDNCLETLSSIDSAAKLRDMYGNKQKVIDSFLNAVDNYNNNPEITLPEINAADIISGIVLINWVFDNKHISREELGKIFVKDCIYSDLEEYGIEYTID